MPQLAALWERLTELAGGGEEEARMLALYCPTPYMVGCSQAVWTREPRMLVRNYDYHPEAFEATFLMTRWSGTRVLASSDCLWGVLDGMNEHGLVAALSFGGSRRVGRGFGTPLILRYVLETCGTLSEAVSVLQRVPSNMAYNVSLLDAAGNYAVAVLAPGRATSVRRVEISTNHQDHDQWDEYVAHTRSRERESFLATQLADGSSTAAAFLERFLEPPLFSTDYEGALGTLYTVAYRPEALQVEYLWPRERRSQTFSGYESDERDITLGT